MRSWTEGESAVKKRILAVFLAAAMLACLLSACGETTTQTDATSDETTTSSADATDAVNTITAITVGIPQDLDSLDPYQMGTAGTREVMFNIFEGLVKLTPDGDYIDAVAASHTVSDDGLTYTFTLRDGVVFHNGQTVTTDDVLYSFETCAASKVNEALATALSAATVEADGNDIIVTLSEPNSDFLAYVSNTYITPADYTEQATAPVGTGPFQFVSYSVQESLVLAKNTAYYGEQAYLDQVTFKIFGDTNAELTALEAGSVDLVAHLTYDQISTLTNGYEVLDSTMNLAVGLYLNNGVAPFDNQLVRQALCYAVDVDEVMAIASGGQGVKIGSSMFPNFGKYFDASLADAYSYDVEKAKELLTEAGYGDGFTFTITYASEYEHPYGDMAAVIKEELALVGITVELNPIEWASWYADVYQNRDFESTIVGFDTSVLTASGMLQRWTSDASKNMINYSNSEYDETYAAAVACTDDEEQTQLYKRCLEILSEDAANVYIQDLAEYVVINPALEGYQFYPLYILDMSTVRAAG
jgi:peptide/nickel transport system substrate-binding protein